MLKTQYLLESIFSFGKVSLDMMRILESTISPLKVMTKNLLMYLRELIQLRIALEEILTLVLSSLSLLMATITVMFLTIFATGHYLFWVFLETTGKVLLIICLIITRFITLPFLPLRTRQCLNQYFSRSLQK